jgi:hypothetical protein
MLKDADKADIAITEEAAPQLRRALPSLRARRLSAIEIAEGALLADIAVVFQLLIFYLPVGGIYVSVMVPTIFAILVLRRGFYVGCMSLCVAIFMVSIIRGPGGVPLLTLEAGAGLFLGLTMRARLSHLLTIGLGVIGGGIALWAILLLAVLLSGGPYLFLLSLHRLYDFATALLGLVFSFIHLDSLWQHYLFPLVDGFMQWSFQHWLVLVYLVASLFCIPLVLVIYFITNFFLRLLGYQVRPFPGYRVEGLLYWLARRLLSLLAFGYLVVCALYAALLPGVVFIANLCLRLCRRQTRLLSSSDLQELGYWLDRYLHNWLIFWYLLVCLLSTGLLYGVYSIMNVFSPLLGYQARALPYDRLRELRYRLARGPLKPVPRCVYAEFRILHHLECEVRRLDIARLRQRRLESENGNALDPSQDRQKEQANA